MAPGVVTFPDCSGEAMLALGFGVETGVEKKLGLGTFDVIRGVGTSRSRSGTVLTVAIVRSIDPGRILFCCSEIIDHATSR